VGCRFAGGRPNDHARPGAHGSFDQIILAAADVDADTFRNLCAAYARVSRRTTLYVSSRDLAVEASRGFTRFPARAFCRRSWSCFAPTR
jgi:esterase/lipase superfamily enzyme